MPATTIWRVEFEGWLAGVATGPQLHHIPPLRCVADRVGFKPEHDELPVAFMVAGSAHVLNSSVADTLRAICEGVIVCHASS